MSYTKEQRIVNNIVGSTISERSRPGNAQSTDFGLFNLPNHSGLTHHKEFKTKTRAWDLIISSPNSVYNKDGEIVIMRTIEPIVITRVYIQLDSDTNQVAGDLKYADDYITQASATVINDFDTTSGVRDDTSITNPEVPVDKTIYLDFDSEPSADINGMQVHIEYYLK